MTMFPATVKLVCLLQASLLVLAQSSTTAPPSLTLSTAVATATAPADATLPSQAALPPKQAWCPSEIFCPGSVSSLMEHLRDFLFNTSCPFPLVTPNGQPRALIP